jgi:DNA-binding transcriptional ArsR family regulator
MKPVPQNVMLLIAQLGLHDNRLPILIALEERPRGATELADDLELDIDPVQWALKTLRKAGLVAVQEQGITSNNNKFGIYATTNRGWTGVLDALALVTKTKNKPRSKRRSSR